MVLGPKSLILCHTCATICGTCGTKFFCATFCGTYFLYFTCDPFYSSHFRIPDPLLCATLVPQIVPQFVALVAQSFFVPHFVAHIFYNSHVIPSTHLIFRSQIPYFVAQIVPQFVALVTQSFLCPKMRDMRHIIYLSRAALSPSSTIVS